MKTEDWIKLKKEYMTKEEVIKHLKEIIEFSKDSCSSEHFYGEYKNDYWNAPWEDPWVQDVAYCEKAIELLGGIA